MTDPYVSQILITGFTWAPRDYAKCDGQSISLSANPTLFSLIGTAYGGDGRSNFSLPDLRGRAPIQFGDMGPELPDYDIAEKGGVEEVTLTLVTMGAHGHQLMGIDRAGDKGLPNADRYLANPGAKLYATGGSTIALYDSSVTYKGGGQAHTNMQPYLVLNFCIALKGAYPSQN